MLLKLLSTALFTLGLSFSASAALIEYDWKKPGDGNVSFDTETGLLWLDLDVTKNKSINEVSALLSVDPDFAGYRLPTLEEIYGLASGLFNAVKNVSQNTQLMYVTTGVLNQEKLNHAVMGGQSVDFTYGIYSKDGVGTHLFGSGNNGLYFNYAWDSKSLNWKRDFEGVYLVSDQISLATTLDAQAINTAYGTPVADVPVYTFAAAGLLLMAFSRVSRKSKK